MGEGRHVPASEAGSNGEDGLQTVGVSRPAPHRVGSLIGSNLSRYVVLGEIGRGGMGRVLRAYDPKLQREVALKEVHAQALAEGVSQRLVAEARAMAKLSHPNVVAVFDVEETDTLAEADADPPVGEADGVVLVMEYVPGTTLRQWLAEQERPWTEVVERFVEAGRGLAAAHDANLLHRDFKPANVLVHEHSARGETGRGVDRYVTKVTDFGLAKGVSVPTSAVSSSSLDADLEAPDSITGVVMGTPRYMAPEQHEGAGRDGRLTPAADQYAFCVALWEALCGEPPFRGRGILSQKRDGPPSWPAREVPRSISDAVLRGLAPDPGDRWPTMHSLLQALAYDAARRRNRWVAGAAAATALVVGGPPVVTWSEARANRCSGATEQIAAVWGDHQRAEVAMAITSIEAAYAQRVWEWSARSLDDYARRWAAMHTEACEATTVSGEQSDAVMDLRMACLHRAKVDLGAVVEVLAAADGEVVQNAHEVLAELRPLSRCADIEGLQADVEPPDPSDVAAVDEARLRVARANAQHKAGRYEAAQQAVVAAREALEGVDYGPVQAELWLAEGNVLEGLGDYEASGAALERSLESAARWHRWELLGKVASKLMFVVARHLRRPEEGLSYLPLAQGAAQGSVAEAAVRNNLAVVLEVQGKYDASESEHRRALALREEALGSDHLEVATSLGNLANALYEQGKFDEAKAHNQRALAIRRQALGPDHPMVASSRHNIGNILIEQGRLAEAEAEHRAALALWEAALPPHHPDLAMSHNNIGRLLFNRGKYADAAVEFQRALEIQQATLGPEHPYVATSRNNLAVVWEALGDYNKAEAEHRRVLALREKTLGPEHPDTLQSRNNIANVLIGRGEYAEAEAQIRQILPIRQKTLGPEHLDVADTHNNLAVALETQGKFEEAQAEHRRALAIRTKVLGSEHAEVALSHTNLALVLGKQGKHEEAEAEYRRAIEIQDKALGPEHPDAAKSRHHLASLLLEDGRVDEAIELAERAWARRKADDMAPNDRGDTAYLLARVLWKGGRQRGRARDLAKRALNEYRTAAAPASEAATKVESWLEAHPMPAGRP